MGVRGISVWISEDRILLITALLCNLGLEGGATFMEKDTFMGQ